MSDHTLKTAKSNRLDRSLSCPSILTVDFMFVESLPFGRSTFEFWDCPLLKTVQLRIPSNFQDRPLSQTVHYPYKIVKNTVPIFTPLAH